MAFNKKYQAKSTQTVFDLALQLHGSADGAFDMLSENPEIENVNSDPTGIEVDYQINNTYIQKQYIAKGIEVSTKPIGYYNTLDDAIIISEFVYLVQSDGYRILM